MLTQSDYVMMRVHKDAYNRAYNEAEKLRALRRAGLIQSSQLTKITCWAAGRLGRALMAVGQKLVRIESASNASFRSSAGLGNA